MNFRHTSFDDDHILRIAHLCCGFVTPPAVIFAGLQLYVIQSVVEITLLRKNQMHRG
jgi:hypothetical protein